MVTNNLLQQRCLELFTAYKDGKLGNQTMPEDAHPEFNSQEERLAYFTLPMSLNYQRNSYSLWEAADKTFRDDVTKSVFSVSQVAVMSQDDLRDKLTKYKVALQPNKHTSTWHRIEVTISSEWGSVKAMLDSVDGDFLKLQQCIQVEHKKSFPYLSGPKIFHYWSYILGEYCGVTLKNREYIQIAPDTHVVQCSILLGVITADEALKLKKDEVSDRWRKALQGTGLSPIDMHSPLWFWSRNGFKYKLSV